MRMQNYAQGDVLRHALETQLAHVCSRNSSLRTISPLSFFTMWQGKSMIPKPRLQTPSRNPRTPSRLPRPRTNYTDPPANTPCRTTTPQRNSVYKRGDTLAERVIATGIICNTATNKSSFSLPQSISQSTPPNMPSSTPPCTPPRTPPRAHLPNSPEQLVIDEQLVTRTPAKHKNTEWLASFGIDISLLKLTDDEENHHPNLTPVRDNYQSPYQSLYSPEKTPSSANSKPKSFQRRRATDFYAYAQSTDTLPNPPTRIASSRKSRRASARISVRELDALKFRREEPSVALRATAGSDVFLTPVRASKKQREKNGTPVVLSEVRRSLRINTPSKELVPKNSVRGRIELLEANDHSYIPNPTLSDRSSSG